MTAAFARAGDLRIERRIESLLAEGGLWTDSKFAHPYHSDGLGAVRQNHARRKRRLCTLSAAASRLNLHLAASTVIRERLSDLEAGAHAGSKLDLLVETRHGQAEGGLCGETDFGVMIALFIPSLADIRGSPNNGRRALQ